MESPKKRKKPKKSKRLTSSSVLKTGESKWSWAPPSDLVGPG